jgi:hypothetical protein
MSGLQAGRPYKQILLSIVYHQYDAFIPTVLYRVPLCGSSRGYSRFLLEVGARDDGGGTKRSASQ